MRFSSFLLESALDLLLEAARTGSETALRGVRTEVEAGELSRRMSKRLNKALDDGHIMVNGKKHPFTHEDLHMNHDTEHGYHPGVEHIRKEEAAKFSRKSGPDSYTNGLKDLQHYRHEGKKANKAEDKSPNGVYKKYSEGLDHNDIKESIQHSSHTAVHHLMHAGEKLFRHGSRYEETNWTSNGAKDLKQMTGHDDPDNTSDIATRVRHSDGSDETHGASLKAKDEATHTNFKGQGKKVQAERAGIPLKKLKDPQEAHKQRLRDLGFENVDKSETDLHKENHETRELAAKGNKRAKKMLAGAEESKKRMLEEHAAAYHAGLEKKLHDDDPVKKDQKMKDYVKKACFPPTKNSYSVITNFTNKKAGSKGSIKSTQNPEDELHHHLEGYHKFRIEKRGNQTVTFATHKESQEEHRIFVDGKKTNNSWSKHGIATTSNLPQLEKNQKASLKK